MEITFKDVAVSFLISSALPASAQSPPLPAPSEIVGCWKQESLKGHFKASTFDDSQADCVVKISKDKILRNCAGSNYAGNTFPKEWVIEYSKQWENSKLKRVDSIPGDNKQRPGESRDEWMAGSNVTNLLRGIIKYDISGSKLTLRRLYSCVAEEEARKFGFGDKDIIKEGVSCKNTDILYDVVFVLNRVPDSECTAAAFSGPRKSVVATAQKTGGTGPTLIGAAPFTAQDVVDSCNSWIREAKLMNDIARIVSVEVLKPVKPEESGLPAMAVPKTKQLYPVSINTQSSRGAQLHMNVFVWPDSFGGFKCIRS